MIAHCSLLLVYFFQVDVIVNTTNDTVDLTATPCGKALLKVAGPELIKECKKIGNLKTGEMASTGTGKTETVNVYIMFGHQPGITEMELW